MLNKTEIANKFTRKFHKIGFTLKKHSPEILVGVGVAGTVATTVLACKATLKVGAVLEEARTQIDEIDIAREKIEKLKEEAKEKGAELSNVNYTDEDHNNDLKVVYLKTGFELAKLYAVPVTLGVASIACILGGHKILKGRNAALATAYAGLMNDYKGYRSRVVERFGEALDKELKYNIKTKEIEEIVVNEDGSEAIVKKSVQAIDDQYDLNDRFSRVFDDGCTGWDPNPDYSKMFLIQQQNYANEKLKRQGFLPINDVYEMLGFNKIPEGQVVGWIYDEKHPVGDNYIDFGLTDIHKEKVRDFINGYEQVIILEFNHDGYILDKM